MAQVRTQKQALWDSNRLSQYVKEQAPPLNIHERLQLCNALAKLNLFTWLDYIGQEIKELASTDPEYVSLLSEVLNKVRNDLAQGPIIEALIAIGFTNPDSGLKISEIMRLSNEEPLGIYSGFLLGGAGRTKYALVAPVIDSLWASKNITYRIAVIRAYRVIVTSDSAPRADLLRTVFNLLHEAAITENVSVKQETANALIDFAKFDQKKCLEILEPMLEESTVRAIVARRLQVKSSLDTSSIVFLLRRCSEDNDDNVLAQVATALAFRGKDFPREAFEIVLDLLGKGKYSAVQMLDFAAAEIAKMDLRSSADAVDSFLRNSSSVQLEYMMPYFLADTFESDYTVLTNPIQSWLLADKRLQGVALRSLDQIMGRVFGSKVTTIADSFFPIVESYAKAKGVDVERIIRSEEDPVARTIELVRLAQTEKHILDYSEIKKNWASFPYLRQFLGNNWIKTKESESNRTHEILRSLANLSNSNANTWPKTILDYLETMVKAVHSLPNTASLKHALKSDEQFQDAFSELQVANAFIGSGYEISIEPRVGNKKLDLAVAIDRTLVLFEIITPRLFRPLKYSSRAVSTPNRARSKVFDEFKKHLSQIPAENRNPVLIAMDITSSDIDYDFVADYLYGSLQFTFWTDKKTGEIVDQGATRASDSLGDLAKGGLENLNVISAVACYKTIYGPEGTVYLSGQIFLNPTARTPLFGNLPQKISTALFMSKPQTGLSPHQ